jgi:hypothetical protein
MSTIDEFRSATFAAQSYDATIAEAWASSPLGDPAIEDGSLSDLAKSEDFPPTTVIAKPDAEPRTSRGSNVLVAAAVVAALGMVSGLGLMLLDGTGSKQEKPAAVVVPNSGVGSALPPAPSEVPPSPVAPAPPSVATPPDSGQAPTGPVSGGDAPALSGPAPAPAPVGPAAQADPGTPPAGTPNTPPVIVNAPPVVPVPILVPVPPHPGCGWQGGCGQQGGGGKQGGGKQGGGKQGGGQQSGGNSGGGQQGGGQQGGGQQGGKGQKFGGQPVPIGGSHPGQVACLPCQQPPVPGKK